ncbi:MAG: hypothetical protein U1A06_18835 [Hoeflea sp.]|nr:hypothetical protein [Hoeflea sp.]
MLAAMDDAGRGGDFASVEPVSREILARVIGEDRSIDLLIDDLREELRDRPYEFVRLPEAGST